MATPKKKVSRSRRNMRRFAAGNQLEVTAVVTSPINQESTRPHRITKALLASGRYLEATASYQKRQKQATQAE
jgi:ribosomal protein L32